MMCYRDKTFCVAKCATWHCDRKFTKEVSRSASRWWGGNDAPISMADFSVVCPDYKPLDDAPLPTKDPGDQ